MTMSMRGTEVAAARPDSFRCSCALTPRQMQVARLVSLGLTNRQIAGRLSLSASTVRNIVSAIYERVGQSGRAYLATLLAEGRLVETRSRVSAQP